jgi:cell division septation protein DedD
MRFEIKTGGWILILFGLVGLSLIVFALGLFAGYDMARNTAPESPQTASVYPLPNPPADLAKAPSKLPDQSVAPPSVAAKAADKTRVAGGVDSTASSSSQAMDKNAGPVAAPRARPAANTVTSAPPPRIAPAETVTDERPRAPKPAAANPNPAEKYASATTDSSEARPHKPFNIQIDAVMDRTNAEQMTTRLQKLGYHAFMVPTDISGQTWWRVRVGPYQSQEEASTAEQELRAKYKDSYVP